MSGEFLRDGSSLSLLAWGRGGREKLLMEVVLALELCKWAIEGRLNGACCGKGELVPRDCAVNCDELEVSLSDGSVLCDCARLRL